MSYRCLSFDLLGWHLEISYEGQLDQSWWVRTILRDPCLHSVLATVANLLLFPLAHTLTFDDNGYPKTTRRVILPTLLLNQTSSEFRFSCGNIHGVVNVSLVSTPKDTPYTSCLDFLSLSIQIFLLPGPWPASTAIHIAHMPLYFLRLGYFSQTKYW